MRADVPEESVSQVRVTAESALISAVPIAVHRGRLEDARRMVNDTDELAGSADVQDRAIYSFNSATVLLGSGNAAKALASAEAAFDHRESLPAGQEVIKESFVVAVQAALALDRLDKAEELLALVEGLPPGQRTQFYNAHVARFRAQLAARRGESDEADRLFKGACGLFHELAMPFYLAVTRLEHAEWLDSQGRAVEAEPLLVEARQIFERLQAAPWLERVAKVSLVGAPD
jgi:ATP/maltotriose-dependent transcriptional regulator MalT